jgi:hypothetical protein
MKHNTKNIGEENRNMIINFLVINLSIPIMKMYFLIGDVQHFRGFQSHLKNSLKKI